MPFSIIFIGLILFFSPLQAQQALENQPLLIPGKQSLFQRVLAIPGAKMYTAPDQQAEVKAIQPFDAFYVYAREQKNGQTWLNVGENRFGEIIGWVPETDLIEWNQGLTLSFRDPLDQDRVLLFENAKTLKKLADNNDVATFAKWYAEAESGTPSPDSPVVAIQPPGFIDIQKDFYLVPIRDHEDVFLGNETARLLKVASVPLDEPQAAKKPDTQPNGARAIASPTTELSPEDAADVANITQAAEKPTPEQNQAKQTATAAAVSTPAKPFRAGIVFVIDSTLSMQPYIDRTKEAVEQIYRYLEQSELEGRLDFGLIGFRDNLLAVPELGYTSQIFVNLEQGGDRDGFFSQIERFEAADVSSFQFVEDAYAGVRLAVEGMNWADYDARYVILITDAGARDADDPLSSTGLSSAGLRQIAQQQNLALFALHLLTHATQADHAKTADQYRSLTHYPEIGSLYYGVPTGDVEAFGHALDALAGQLATQVRIASDLKAGQDQPTTQVAQTEAKTETEEPPASVLEAAEPINEVMPDTTDSADVQLAELQAKVDRLGYALRLRYLANRKPGADPKAPRVFEAWLLDRDFKQPSRQTVQIRVLLTRDQLSDLHDILRQVLTTAEEGLISPQGFLNELKSLAATVTRDPKRLGETTAATAGQGRSLADLGFMREYIEDLPYKGEIMDVSLQDWETWSAAQQLAFLHRLEEKTNYYRALHDHTDLWVALDGGPIDGDAVYPVTLEMLP